jgi:hypothetical protein
MKLKNLGIGLGFKLKEYIKIKAIASSLEVRLTCIMLILENFNVKNS